MSVPCRELAIDRRAITRRQWLERGPAEALPVADGQILVEIDALAFTANNVSYLQLGEMIGYWRLFPIAEPHLGLLPAMGYARVVRSRCPAISVGERLWGFFPVATHRVLQPVHVEADRFEDFHGSRAAMYEKEPHMRPYQRYFRIPAKADFVTDHEAIQSALRGQFITSYLMDAYLQEKDFFGARQVLITSASSRTAIAGAWLSARHEGIRVIGLTSPGNHAFVEKLGCYHEVRRYDEIPQLDRTVPTAIIDVAGNGHLIRQLHEHYGDNVKYDGSLGKAHPSAPMPPKNLPGATPRMFFAPKHIERQIGQFGAAGFDERVATVWKAYEAKAAGWFAETRIAGADAIGEVYDRSLKSGFDPAHINILEP